MSEKGITMLKFVDTHAHLTSEQILPHVDAVLERAKTAGVDQIVNICTDVETLRQGVALRKKYPWVFNAAATTPHDVEKEGELFFPIVEQHAKDNLLVAIGETGLDYYYEHSPKQIQKHYLERYFALALQARLPVIFHCRNAFEDLFSMADVHYAKQPAVLHCFTGTIEEARGVLDRGWYLSFSGVVTYKKSQELREVAKYVPLDRIFLETDAPYLAPQSRRGQQNEPAYMLETAACLAETKQVALADLAAQTKTNAETFFSFSKPL
ncbi:MAG: TatD family hydrolase [Chlamydiota bacterium]